MSKLSLRQIFIEDKFLVMHLIGAGHFGEIRVAKNVETEENYAVKLEDAIKGTPKLEKEMKLYEKLKDKYDFIIAEEKKENGSSNIIYGFPAVYNQGRFENYNYLIMELLGYNLETLYNSCNRKFTLKCIVMIGIQILQRLEFIHSCDIVFRDVKPENFVIGKESIKRGEIIYMLDFGLAQDLNDTLLFNQSTAGSNMKKIVGTSRYMSINAHKGKEQSRRDDLESLAYILIYFSVGRLPWQGIPAEDIQDKYKKILELKTSIKTSTLCKGLSNQFNQFLAYVKLLNFDEIPDYNHLRNLLYETLSLNSEVLDWKFDWEGRSNALQLNSEESTGLPEITETISKSKDMFLRYLCCGFRSSIKLKSRR